MIPYRWSAPEVLLKGKWTEKSDVWAFGVTLWELYTDGMIPYGFGVQNKEVSSIVEKGGTLNRPEECPDYMWDVITSCWVFSEEKRPNFLQLGDRLTRCMEALGQGGEAPRGMGYKKVLSGASTKASRGTQEGDFHWDHAGQMDPSRGVIRTASSNAAIPQGVGGYPGVVFPDRAQSTVAGSGLGEGDFDDSERLAAISAAAAATAAANYGSVRGALS